FGWRSSTDCTSTVVRGGDSVSVTAVHYQELFSIVSPRPRPGPSGVPPRCITATTRGRLSSGDPPGWRVPMPEPLLIEHAGPVLHLRMNRPGVHNAFD